MEINTLELRNEASLIAFASSLRFGVYKQSAVNRLHLNYKAKLCHKHDVHESVHRDTTMKLAN